MSIWEYIWGLDKFNMDVYHDLFLFTLSMTVQDDRYGLPRSATLWKIWKIDPDEEGWNYSSEYYVADNTSCWKKELKL